MSDNDIVTPEEWANSVSYAWRNMELKLRTGATEPEFAQAEKRLAYQFDPFFKAIYSLTNGFGDGDWLGHLIVFWPLDQISGRLVSHTSADFIAFGDYMISSAEYCFKKGESGVYKLYDLADAEPEKVASSFRDFVLMINRDDMLVY